MSREMRYLAYQHRIVRLKPIIKECSICKGYEFYPTGKMIDKFTFETRTCKCKKLFMKKKSYVLANIPRKHQDLLTTPLKRRAVINLFTNKRVPLYTKVVAGYLAKFQEARERGLGMMFFGDAGTGKTTAAIYILLNLLKQRVDGFYIFFKDLISLLIQSYEDQSKKLLFEEIIEVDFLIIDELSLVGRVTPHMVAEFTSLCKQRFESGLPTLLISNYQTTDEIFTNFGAPMESLMNEAFLSFKFKGHDLRTDKFEFMKQFFE
jgi:DNA replication protein DnaC